MIRSTSSPTPADEQQILNYIQEISRAMQDTVARTHDAIEDLSNPALKKHVVPVVDVLEDCRQNMVTLNIREGGSDRIPPLAFKTARAMKVR
jgi:hypothetical protein